MGCADARVDMWGMWRDGGFTHGHQKDLEHAGTVGVFDYLLSDLMAGGRSLQGVHKWS